MRPVVASALSGPSFSGVKWRGEGPPAWGVTIDLGVTGRGPQVQPHLVCTCELWALFCLHFLGDKGEKEVSIFSYLTRLS